MSDQKNHEPVSDERLKEILLFHEEIADDYSEFCLDSAEELSMARELLELRSSHAAAIKDLENLRLMLAGEELADCEGVVELIIAKLEKE